MQGRIDSASHAEAIARVGEGISHAWAFRGHLDEIMSGPAFKGSQRCQDFLRFVVEHALERDFDMLRERNLGMALFGRPLAYDTGEDAIVRVTASDVRRRLMQHYGNTAHAARYRIALPPGSYVPEFRCLPSVPAPPAEDPAPSVPQPRRRWIVPAVAAAALGLALAGWELHERVIIRIAPPPNFISQAFQDPASPVQIIASDDALVLIQVLLGHRVTLAEYENLSYRSLPDLVRQKGLERFWGSLSTRQITNLGDLQNANRIADNLRRRDWNVTIRHARQAHARDFHSGNFIVLGSSFSNPWVQLFSTGDLDFTVAKADPGMAAPVLNRRPRPGEAAVYAVQTDPKTGKLITYARVCLLENTGHSGRVLLVAGVSMSATEMAGEFLLRPESLSRIAHLLGVSASGPVPNCELLLRVSEVNETGDGVELLAVHRH
jgi:hypothetical protein